MPFVTVSSPCFLIHVMLILVIIGDNRIPGASVFTIIIISIHILMGVCFELALAFQCCLDVTTWSYFLKQWGHASLTWIGNMNNNTNTIHSQCALTTGCNNQLSSFYYYYLTIQICFNNREWCHSQQRYIKVTYSAAWVNADRSSCKPGLGLG